MEEIEVVLQRHEQQIKTLERDMTDMKTVQAEIRSMHVKVIVIVFDKNSVYRNSAETGHNILCFSAKYTCQNFKDMV